MGEMFIVSAAVRTRVSLYSHRRQAIPPSERCLLRGLGRFVGYIAPTLCRYVLQRQPPEEGEWNNRESSVAVMERDP